MRKQSVVGRLRAIRVLREHHRTHHRVALSERWNFNVTLPLWDVIMSTRWRPESQDLWRLRLGLAASVWPISVPGVSCCRGFRPG